jgi:hypothetical protein
MNARKPLDRLNAAKGRANEIEERLHDFLDSGQDKNSEAQTFCALQIIAARMLARRARINNYGRADIMVGMELAMSLFAASAMLESQELGL